MESSEVQPKQTAGNATEDKITNSRGQKLYCKYWNADKTSSHADLLKTRGLVFVVHGLAEHCLLYNEVAEVLTNKGFYVFAHDHVGHGQSEGSRSHIDDFAHYVEDVFQHIDLLKAKFLDNTPVFLVGHSMGGTIGVLCALARPEYFAGVILIGPAIQQVPGSVSPAKVMIVRLLARVFPQLCVGKLNTKELSHDPEAVKEYEDDPLVFHNGVKAKWGVAFLKAMDVMKADMAKVTCPLFIMHGEQDKMCALEGSQELYSQAQSKDKEIKIYKGFYHQIHRELREDRDVVLKDLVGWLENRV